MGPKSLIFAGFAGTLNIALQKREKGFSAFLEEFPILDWVRIYRLKEN